MRKDNFHQNKYATAVDNTVVASNGTTVGNIFKITNYEAESLTFVMEMRAYASGDAQLLIEESDDGITFAPVADAECDLLGTEVGTNLSEANKTAKIGYIGVKTYVRASIVGANTASFTVGAIAVFSDLHEQGDATQVR